MLIELSRGGFFTATLQFQRGPRRGKVVSRATTKSPDMDKLPRAERSKASKIAKTVDEKLARALLKQRIRQLKSEGLTAHAARETALPEIASRFGYEVSTLETWDSGKADAQRRKPKAERIYARRKGRAKIIP
jgi:hypothetical protein